MSTQAPIGIVSGTGPAGMGLAARLAFSGQTVHLGSRSKDRAAEAVVAIGRSLTTDNAVLLRAASNAEAAACSLVVLATNADHTVSIAGELAPDLADAIVVSMAARVKPGTRRMQPDLPPEGSIAATVALALPSSRVVAALQHVPAKILADLDRPFDADVLVCGDDVDAVDIVIDRLGRITTGTFYDAGPMANAEGIEAMTAVLISLNARYRGRFTLGLRAT